MSTTMDRLKDSLTGFASSVVEGGPDSHSPRHRLDAVACGLEDGYRIEVDEYGAWFRVSARVVVPGEMTVERMASLIDDLDEFVVEVGGRDLVVEKCEWCPFLGNTHCNLHSLTIQEPGIERKSLEGHMGASGAPPEWCPLRQETAIVTLKAPK
jgi:hypothetical protein